MLPDNHCIMSSGMDSENYKINPDSKKKWIWFC